MVYDDLTTGVWYYIIKESNDNYLYLEYPESYLVKDKVGVPKAKMPLTLPYSIIYHFFH